MQILVPISGRSDFFSTSEYFFPKPLIEVSGTTMIELVINNLVKYFPCAKFIFVIDKDEAISFSLDKTLNLLAGPNSSVVIKNNTTSGALCSCLLACDELKFDEELIVANSDQIIEQDLNVAIDYFHLSSADAGVITFESIHPRWSYVFIEEKKVIFASEKSVISRNAIAGFYYFRNASRFIESAKSTILNNDHVNKKFYLSSALNQIILKDGLIKRYQIPSESYHSFYAPSKIHDYELSLTGRPMLNPIPIKKAINVVIPAAGEGSRFANEGWKAPKPFINVGNKSMIENVVDNFATIQSTTTLILRQEHELKASSEITTLADKQCNIKYINHLTEGTACTLLMAREYFDSNDPLLVANSDQIVDCDLSHFVDDCANRSLDGSILVFKDPTKNPKWSFAKVNKNGLVTEVAEKKPISELATVGIYLFSSGKTFIHCAMDMILENYRVNGEFYTCPIYNYMIKQGMKIGIYEIEQNVMHGIGTPQDLNNYLSMKSLPKSNHSPN